MLGKFVSINMYIKDKYDKTKTILLNPSESSLIYWWNPNDDFVSSLLSEESLKEYILQLCKDKYIYENGNLDCFYLEDEDIEEYSNKKISFQEIFPITILNKEDYYNYFISILKELYIDVYKEEYLSDETDLDKITKDIYTKIISGVKRKILQSTVSNYIYKEIKERSNLNNKNITELIKIFNNIIERTQ